MFKIVTITKQGQISIPASFWKKLGLRKGIKARIRVQDGKMIIELLAAISDKLACLRQNDYQKSSGVVDHTAGEFKGKGKILTAEEERAAVEKAIAVEAINRSGS